MEEYKPNSHKYKMKQAEAAKEKEKIEKVVKGSVKTKKKSGVSKFADVFIAEDAMDVKSYVVMDVLVPAVKKLISDIVTDGIDIILYGGSRRSSKSRGSEKILYGSYYEKKDDRRYRDFSRNTGFRHGTIVIDNRREAEEVLMHLDDLIDKYGVATVGDLHDLLGITGEYTDEKYGWTSIKNAKIVRSYDGYELKMPRAMVID